jgi:ATP synthase protein I
MNDHHEELESAERSMAAGYSVVGGLLVGTAVGYVLDRWLGTAPWLLVVCLVAGLGIALFGISRVIGTRQY